MISYLVRENVRRAGAQNHRAHHRGLKVEPGCVFINLHPKPNPTYQKLSPINPRYQITLPRPATAPRSQIITLARPHGCVICDDMGASAVHITRIEISKLGIEPRTDRALLDKHAMVRVFWRPLVSNKWRAATRCVVRGAVAEADYASRNEQSERWVRFWFPPHRMPTGFQGWYRATPGAVIGQSYRFPSRSSP